MSKTSIPMITADLISALAGIGRLAAPESLPARCQIVQRCYARSQDVDSLTVGELLQLSNSTTDSPSTHQSAQDRAA